MVNNISLMGPVGAQSESVPNLGRETSAAQRAQSIVLTLVMYIASDLDKGHLFWEQRHKQSRDTKVNYSNPTPNFKNLTWLCE